MQRNSQNGALTELECRAAGPFAPPPPAHPASTVDGDDVQGRYRAIFHRAPVSLWEQDFSQVKAAIDDLKTSGVADFRDYFVHHPEFVATAISLVRIVDVNEATLRLFAADTKQELLESLQTVFVPDSHAMFAAELLAIAEGRQYFEAETSLRTLKGEPMAALLTVAFPAPHDPFDSVVVTVTDITRRKRAEDALRNSEREMRELVEAMPAWAWSSTAQGGNAFVSRRWTEYTGLTAAESAASGWTTAIHPDDIARHIDKWRESVVSGQPFETEARFRRAADGQYRWFLVRGVPVRDEGGAIVEWYGFAADIEDRKRVEQASRRSEAYLADAQKLTHTGSWALSPASGKLHYCSEELYRVWGFDPEHGIPDLSAILARIHPEDRERIATLWEKGLEDGFTQDVVVSHRILLPDGTVKHLHGISHPVFDTTGRLVEYIGTGVDVTELKRAEEAVRRSEAYLVQAQKLTRTGSWVWDPRTDVFLHCSEELLGIFGFRQHERWPTVEEFLERVHPEDRERIRKRSVEGALGQTEHGAEYRLLLPDGAIKRIRSIRHPILNDIGEVVQVLGTAMDITDLKRSEEALRRSQAYLAEAQKLTHTGSWARNMGSGETTHSSDEHSRLFGFDPEVGVPSFEAFSQRVHPEDRTRVAETFDRAIHEGSDFAIDFRTLLPDGTVKHIHGVGHPVFDDAGDIIEYIGTAVDVTQSKRAQEERMKLEERLRQAEKMEAVGRFATGIAHDFNNVLVGILGYGEMLFDEAPEDSKRKRYAQSVLTAATRGRELIDQILAYSRNQRGKHQPTELCRAVAETTELIAITLPSTVRLNTCLPDEQLVVMGNATQLHQIVMNLCRNSMHAMGEGGMLGVAIKALEVDSDCALLHGTLRPGRYGCVTVEDTGCGMDPETLSRIFEPFFTTKEVGRGTGLGLALVHAIVSDLGGAIDVKSTPGEGSTFSIYLPLIDLPMPVSSA